MKVPVHIAQLLPMVRTLLECSARFRPYRDLARLWDDRWSVRPSVKLRATVHQTAFFKMAIGYRSCNMPEQPCWV